jgi:hypothetical protein
MMNETFVAVITLVLLLISTAIVGEYVTLPYASLSSPYAIALLVIASLGAFAISPVVGLAALLLTAVLLFKRNLYHTINTQISSYGERSIMEVSNMPAAPYISKQSGPRSYPEFQETNPTNPMLKVEEFVNTPAPYGDEQGSPVDGQFVKEAPRASSVPQPVDYVYRPDETMGDNSFDRFGPDLDVKKKVFSY